MRRKRNLIISASCALAFFLALTGCSKGDSTIEQQQVNVEDNNEVVQPIEQPVEQPVEEQKELQTKAGFTGELFVRKNLVVSDLTATLRYAGGSTTNMTATGNAALVGLDDTVFSVNANKCESSNFPGLNTAGDIRLYCKTSNGNGGYIEVSVGSGYQITNININFNSNGEYAKVDTNGSEEWMSPVDGFCSINASSFRIKNKYSGGSSTTVSINSVLITYEAPAANEVVESTLITRTSLSYNYLITGDGAIDKLTKSNTYALSEEEGSSYKNWESSFVSSGISYKGFTNGASKQEYIQMTNTDSIYGIVTTANANNLNAKRVIVKWNASTTNGRTVDIYGKNTPYSLASDLYGSGDKGTKIGSLTYDSSAIYKENVLSINTPYKYIGIRSNSGAAFLDFVQIYWDVAFSYSNVAIRFGNLMKKTLWDRLNSESTIEKYGVMLSTAEYLGAETIQDKYETALTANSGDIDVAIASICSGNDIKNFSKSIPGDKANPDLATDEQKGELVGDYYIWNLYKNISEENLKAKYSAVAYIRTTANGIVFLNETTTSTKDLAHSLLDSGAYPDNEFDGTLANLAYLA